MLMCFARLHPHPYKKQVIERGGGERERERERQTDRQTDRDRETERDREYK